MLVCICYCLGLLAGFPAQAGPDGRKPSAKASQPGTRALALRKALAGADRLVVRQVDDGSPDHKPPVTIAGADKIAGLLAVLDFRENGDTHPCACGGDTTITFYMGDKVLAELTHAHGISLRWNKWSGGGSSEFTSAAALAWPKWFDENGYPDYERNRRLVAAAAEHGRSLDEMFLRELPAAARKAIGAYQKSYEQVAGNLANLDAHQGKESVGRAARVFLKSCGKPFDGGFALCRAMGALENEDLSARRAISMNEELAQLAFDEIETDYLSSIFEAAVRDTQASFGAARLFFYYKIHRKLPDVTRDALAPRLLRVVIERDCVENGLSAIRETGEIAAMTVTETLRDVAACHIKPTIPQKRVDQEPALRFAAILALARRGDMQVKNLIDDLAGHTANPSDQAALAIARCFLGVRGTIRAEHCQLHSWSLGYASVAALEKQGDREAMNLIITGCTLHPSAMVSCEAVHAIQRLTGKTWYHAMPNENEDWYGKDIREWWNSAKDTWQASPGATD